MQIQAGTVRSAGMSDQPVGPLEREAENLLQDGKSLAEGRRMEEIWEKLMSAKVNAAPRKAIRAPGRREAAPSAGFDLPAARLRRVGGEDQHGDGEEDS